MKLALTSFFFVAAITLHAQTVTIGTQVWMTKNLDVSTFRNGDPIPQAKTVEEWKKAGGNRQPAWCYYNNDPANGAKYGKLYNWYAVNDPRGIAPVGYHIPSYAEWRKLQDYLGSDAGAQLKSKNGWNSYETGGSKTCPNCVNWNAEYRRKVPCHTCQDTRSVPAPKVSKSGNGNNNSGFSGLPGGALYDNVTFRNVTFRNVGQVGYWWSSQEVDDDSGDAYNFNLYYDYFSCYGPIKDDKRSGFSVRCLRD